MKFYGYYQVQLPYGIKADPIVKWLNEDVLAGKYWMRIGGVSQGIIENTYKVCWYDCFDMLLKKAKELDIQIGVHFYQEYNEDTAGDWHADLGYYEDGRAYCVVREAYIEDVKWSCGKDILEDIEQVDLETKEDLF